MKIQSNFVARFWLAVFAVAQLSACVGISNEAHSCGGRMRDTVVIEKMKSIHAMDKDLAVNGEFEVKYNRHNYFVKFTMMPKVPGGEIEAIFDCAGDLIALSPGR